MNNKAAFHINSGNNMMRLCMLSVYSLRNVCTVPSLFSMKACFGFYKKFLFCSFFC